MIYAAKRAKTRSKIKRTFIELYKKRDISSITVKDVCAGAGINRSTFYDYYKDVFDLREDIENETIDILQKKFSMMIAEEDEADFEEIVLELVEEAHKNDDIPFLLIMKNSAKYVDKIVEVVKSGAVFDVSEMSDKEMRRIQIAIEYHFSGIVSILARYGIDSDAEEIVRLLVEIANRGAISILKGYIK